MLSIVMAGLNHRTSPIEIRERFFFLPLEREVILAELKNDPRVVEAFVLSTCNRTEIYAAMLEPQPEVLLEAIFGLRKIADGHAFRKFFYTHKETDAVRHLLRVACGLDSLVLGEKQILAQLKEAFSLAASKVSMGRTFNILSNFVLQTGRKARRETQIDFGGVSVSGAAVDMARRFLGGLHGKTVLILGSGKMGTLTLEHLRSEGASRIFVMNRTLEKAQELAQSGQAEAVPFWEIESVLAKADVCICSTGCPHYLIDKDLVSSSMTKRPERSLVCVDISIPRNIAPDTAQVPNVSLFTVDDLDRAVEGNIQTRLSCVDKVEEIVTHKVEEFYRSLYAVRGSKPLNVQKENFI